jgi:hypothetical protein
MRIFMLVVMCMCASLAAQDINDTRYSFTARMPAGFQAWPSSRRMPSASTIYCYYLGDLNDDQPEVVIGIEHLGGVIGREKLDGKSIPPGLPTTNVSMETETWKEFEINVFSMQMNTNGYLVHGYSAQVPLKKEAIQINIAGLESRRAEIREYLRFVLANLDGESNWLTGSERIAKLAGGLLGLGLFVGFIVLVIYYFVRTSRKKAAQAAMSYAGFPGAIPVGFPVARGPGPPGYPQPAYPRSPAPYPPGQVVYPAPIPHVQQPLVQEAPPAPEPEKGPVCSVCGAPKRAGRRSCMSCGASS